MFLCRTRRGCWQAILSVVVSEGKHRGLLHELAKCQPEVQGEVA